ncbi:transposase [Streptomyces sp. NPDC048845]|uniref:transposase n=1 Tax=Streptomyces sp. NPDC048845 TaxID=3155390 RepID=UPI00344589C8
MIYDWSTRAFLCDHRLVDLAVPLTDARWARIEPLLPDRTPRRGGRWRDHRQVIDTIAWNFQTGSQWVHLPAEDADEAARTGAARSFATGPDAAGRPVCQQIMAVFAGVNGPVRARAVCEAMNLEMPPSSVNNLRLELKRLVGRKVLVEAEPGFFTLPPAVAAQQAGLRPTLLSHPQRRSGLQPAFSPKPHWAPPRLISMMSTARRTEGP